MNKFLASLDIARHGKKGVIFDTNVLLLFIVGSKSPELIPNHKKTRNFTVEEFEVLCKIAKFSKILVTPNILTEASNLLETNNDQYDQDLLHRLKQCILNFDEMYIQSKTECMSSSFLRLGLSDTLTLDLSKSGFFVVTSDIKLYTWLCNHRCHALNINHIKSYI